MQLIGEAKLNAWGVRRPGAQQNRYDQSGFGFLLLIESRISRWLIKVTGSHQSPLARVANNADGLIGLA
jgi:hypothetical protein